MSANEQLMANKAPPITRKPPPGTMPRSAIWVGGFPGRLRGKICADLEAINISIKKTVEREFASPPNGCDLILINKDMCDENLQRSARIVAGQHGIDWSYVALNFVRTCSYLKQRNLFEFPELGDQVITRTKEEEASNELELEPVFVQPSLESRRARFGGVDLYEEGGRVYAVATALTGQERRRMCPVVVEDALFLSYMSAADFLEVSASHISDALVRGAKDIKGFSVHHPTYEEAMELMAETPRTKLITPVDPPTQVLTESFVKTEPMEHVSNVTVSNAATRIINPEPRKMFRATKLRSGRVVVEPLNIEVKTYDDVSHIPPEILSLCEWDGK